MENENKGYTLAVINSAEQKKAEKTFLKPMALYVPAVASAAVAELIAGMRQGNNAVMIAVTNNNNGVSVDKDFSSLDDLHENAADAVKELINIVRGYESDEETNVCGW